MDPIPIVITLNSSPSWLDIAIQLAVTAAPVIVAYLALRHQVRQFQHERQQWQEQLNLDQTHKQWEALRWALELFGEADVAKINELRTKTAPEEVYEADAYITWLNEQIAPVERKLEILVQAIESGYINKDQYMKLRCSELSNLHPDCFDPAAAHYGQSNDDLHETIAWTFNHGKVGGLVREAREVLIASLIR